MAKAFANAMANMGGQVGASGLGASGIVDVDECAAGSDECSEYADCSNNFGNYFACISNILTCSQQCNFLHSFIHSLIQGRIPALA